ncbi:NepR family anti-sigma factor [Roseobacter cerasinus]|uniref:NepR family anti-sigma factor n=1 Tax=Roseobacter cerasinus TaxID=2602289 RepID=UPI003F68627A
MFGSDARANILMLLGLVRSMTQADTNGKRESVIDENLKRVFEETLDEGVPDRFKDLLDALKQQDQGKGATK